MYSKIILVCLLFSVVNCDLNKEEGDACEWEGVKGTCVNSHRCLTTLDETSPKQPVCTQKGQETIVCCTDCELVNDTRNVVILPTGLSWKTGQKAWDKCLQFVAELPYECHLSFHSGLTRTFNEEKKCHGHDLWGVGGPPAIGTETNKYPHMARIGFTKASSDVSWFCGGTIISEKYILTAGQCATHPELGSPTFVAYGILNSESTTEGMKRVGVKRVITHPDYKSPKKYNDIALIEVDTPIIFNKNVLPACLHIALDAFDDNAVTTTWKNLTSHDAELTNTLSEIHVKKYGEEICSAEYPIHRHLVNGFDGNTQLCYGDKDQPSQVCKGLGGEPLLIKTHVSSCVYTAIGVTSFGKHCKGSRGYDVYTKVSYYVPWIESVVWP